MGQNNTKTAKIIRNGRRLTIQRNPDGTFAKFIKTEKLKTKPVKTSEVTNV